MMLRGDPESSTQGRSQVHSSGDGKVSTPEVSSGSRPPHALAEQRYQSTSQTAPAAAPNVPVTGALADAHGQKPGSLGTAQRSSQQLPEHAGHPRKRAHDLRISTGPAGAGASSAITVGDVGHIRPHTPVGRPSTARRWVVVLDSCVVVITISVVVLRVDVAPCANGSLPIRRWSCLLRARWQRT